MCSAQHYTASLHPITISHHEQAVNFFGTTVLVTVTLTTLVMVSVGKCVVTVLEVVGVIVTVVLANLHTVCGGIVEVVVTVDVVYAISVAVDVVVTVSSSVEVVMVVKEI